MNGGVFQTCIPIHSIVRLLALVCILVLGGKIQVPLALLQGLIRPQGTSGGGGGDASLALGVMRLFKELALSILHCCCQLGVAQRYQLDHRNAILISSPHDVLRGYCAVANLHDVWGRGGGGGGAPRVRCNFTPLTFCLWR